MVVEVVVFELLLVELLVSPDAVVGDVSFLADAGADAVDFLPESRESVL